MAGKDSESADSKIRNTESIEHLIHDHIFGQDLRKSGERKTLIVIIITAIMMIIEITAGIIFGSMALLADGLHMGSHASALTISALAYYYTRSHARDSRFTFGTGKVNSLAGFASAIMLAIFSIIMAGESIKRFLSPVQIEFNQAIFIAAIGLVINIISLLILGAGHDSYQHVSDHNLWSAYIHVLADALTSVLAIFALICAKYLDLIWLDPFMGLIGAFLIIRWSIGLIRSSAHVLLDMQAPQGVLDAIRKAIESESDNRVCDLHVWMVGPGIYAAEIALVTSTPKDTHYYTKLLPKEIPLVHVTVVVHTDRC